MLSHNFQAARAAAKLERRQPGRRRSFTQVFFDLEPSVRRRIALRIGLSDPRVELTLSDLEVSGYWIEVARRIGKTEHLQRCTWTVWRKGSLKMTSDRYI
jgi:hypothetical protein